MAFTYQGRQARDGVVNIVYARPMGGFDPFDRATFGDLHPHRARMAFDSNIVQYVYDNAPRDAGNPAWYTCRYCNWEYPPDRCQVDHVVNWSEYSATMTQQAPLSAARAFEVWVGCNDPANLVVACQPCNGSKGDRTASAGWINTRRALAVARHGF